MGIWKLCGQIVSVLIDSSVWIGFLRGDAADVQAVTGLISGRNRAALTGPVLQEVLQGIRNEKQRRQTRTFLLRLPILETTIAHYTAAADAYAALRSAGVTVPSVDVLIAAVAGRAGFSVLTRDRHFLEIKKHLDLEVTLLETE
jgi:predicted nucleic acid-binding protein